MAKPIWIIGVGADGLTGLRPELRRQIAEVDYVAGGSRHLEWLDRKPRETFVIRDNVHELIEWLRARAACGRCVVLASGDPMFYGVGPLLSAAFGSEAIRVEPSLSSMQLAFARLGLSWQVAEIVSVHGRHLPTQLLPVLGRSLIGIFSEDGSTPREVAGFFADRGVLDYRVWVCERLGSPDERIVSLSLETLLGPVESLKGFSPLNCVVLERQRPAAYFSELRRRRHRAPGIPDDEFLRPDEGPVLMTHQEVRAVTLAKLAPARETGGTIWDIGSGIGSIAVESAVLNPAADVVAVERSSDQRVWLERNRERFAVYNLRILGGEAPEVLAAETAAPHSIFIGGSGGRLRAILEFCRDRLEPGGRLVANFVTLENVAACLTTSEAWEWKTTVVELAVSRSERLGSLTGLRPQRPIWLVSATKPV